MADQYAFSRRTWAAPCIRANIVKADARPACANGGPLSTGSRSMHLFRTAALLLLAVGGNALADDAVREHLVPQGWESSYHDIHYSPVVRIGDRVIVSGIPTIEATPKRRVSAGHSRN